MLSQVTQANNKSQVTQTQGKSQKPLKSGSLHEKGADAPSVQSRSDQGGEKQGSQSAGSEFILKTVQIGRRRSNGKDYDDKDSVGIDYSQRITKVTVYENDIGIAGIQVHYQLSKRVLVGAEMLLEPAADSLVRQDFECKAEDYLKNIRAELSKQGYVRSITLVSNAGCQEKFGVSDYASHLQQQEEDLSLGVEEDCYPVCIFASLGKFALPASGGEKDRAPASVCMLCKIGAYIQKEQIEEEIF